MRHWDWSKRIVAYLVVAILPVMAFANKPFTTNSNLEINNLKSEPVFRRANNSIGQESGVIRYVYKEHFGPLSGSAEQMARKYLEANAAKFGIEDASSNLQVKKINTSPSGQHVTFLEMHNGIPVFQSEIVVTLDNQNYVSFVASAYRPNLDVKTSTPSISSESAIQTARNYLNVSGKLLAEQKATLMIFQSENDGDLLTYRVQVPTDKPMGDWEVFVNAATAEVVHVKDRMMYDDGSGMVFNPDPLTTAGTTYGGAYQDFSDADTSSLNDERVSVTLKDLTLEGGVYKLQGPYAFLSDEETPNDAFPELADPNGFNYTRAQQEFEDVMVYFHIDSTYRHLMELGYNVPGLLQFHADPHGLDGADNSHYVPSGNYLALGEGGVDDAEDADVIWHEYEHAIQEQITGGMSYTGETMSLQEGASDYWAASYSRAVSEYSWGDVFTWDGHNEFWGGRSADLNWVYPDDYVSGHNGGQIFSSAMMHMWPTLGRAVADQIFIEAHYLWGTNPGMQDAAQAVIQADINLNGGSHLSTIVDWFDFHGLVSAEDYVPTIVHEPLPDTEDLTGPYTVNATIGATQPLNPDSILVYWSTDTTFSHVITMTSLGNGDYTADIPGGFSGETNVQYYLAATDSTGSTATDPAGAPTEFHEFHVGADTEPPVITHNPLRDQAIMRWPAAVSAGVTDNIGIASVELQYHLNNDPEQTVAMTDDNGDGIYSATFNETQSEVSVGDSVFYKITATDASSQSNQTTTPEAGENAFEIIDALGVVLVIDDDVQGSQGNRIVTDKGVVNRSQDSWGRSASDFIEYLQTLGYVVDSTSTATYDAYDWNDFDAVVSSSGANTSTLDSADYRAALVSYAQNGGKLLMEGGEVGYNWNNDAAVAGNVLHITDWDGDDSGDIHLREAFASHPFATNPNVILPTFSINYSGWGDQDAVTAAEDAKSLYFTDDDSTETGMLLYDNNPNPTGGQIVYFPFNWASITDQAGRENLLENALYYLTVQESEPVGLISGTVDLTDTNDDSGVEVSVSGPGTSTTTTTASDGSFSFPGLYNGTHIVTVSHSGYYPYTLSDTVEVVGGGSVTNVNFSLDPLATGTISGQISVTGSDPVADSVIVQINSQGIADTTGTDGTYLLTGIMPDSVLIQASKPGYIPTVVHTFVGNGVNLTIDMELQLNLAPPENLVAEDQQDTHVPLTWNPPRVAGPVSEGFESGTFPPSGWDQIITNATASDTPRTWGLYDIPQYVHSGQYAAGLWWDYNQQDEWLMTPEFTVGTNGQLEFWSFAYQGSTNDDHYYVKISTDGGTTWNELLDLSALPVYDNPDANDFNDYQEPYTLDLSDYEGQDVQLAWQAVDGDGQGLWYIWMIDDVAVTSSLGLVKFDGADLAMNSQSADAQLKQLHLTRELASTSPMRENPDFRYEPRQEADARLISFPEVSAREVQDLTGYQIYRDTSPNIDVLNATPIASTGLSTQAYDDSAVVNGTTYYYVVTADYGADGESPASNEVHATPYNYPPSIPTGFTASNTGTSVSMSWSANPENDVVGYKIYERIDANDWVAIDSTAGLSYSLTVENNHVYQYKLTAYDDEGAESHFTETMVLQVGNIPPENLTAEGGMDGHIFLEWNEPGTQFTIPDSLFYDFEDGEAEFVATGDFALGTPSDGATSAYSGDNAWGTNLSDSYGNDVHSTLTSPELSLFGYTSPMLKFYHWFDTESYFDGGNVKVSNDGGETWTIVTPDSGYPEDAFSTANDFLGGEPGFSGHDIGEMWQSVTFDLSDYADETILIRFDFAGDGSINYPGWFIDNVTVLDNTDYSHMLFANTAYNSDNAKAQLQLGSLSPRSTNSAAKIRSQSEIQNVDPNKVKRHSLLRSIQDLMGYKVYRSTAPITDTTAATMVATVMDTTIFDDWGAGGTGLTNGTTYYYVVVADYGVDGRSASSNEASATPVNEPPLPPDSLIASNTDLSINLNWDASISYDTEGYVIYEKIDDGEYVAIDSTSGTSYTYDVENNHVYSYKLTTYDRDGAESVFSEIVVISIGNIPPESLAAEGGLDGHIFLEWDEPGTQFTIPDSLLWDFEDGTADFTSTGEFALGTPSSGPGEAHSGSNTWGTNLTGEYGSDVHSTLTSPEIDLTNYASPVLKYFQWYDTEGYFDGGNIKISTDGGSTWTIATPDSGYPEDAISTANDFLSGEPAFSGHDGGTWKRINVNLSAYAGETVQIRFDFAGDGSVQYDGWYVDDIVVKDAVTFAHSLAGNLKSATDTKRTTIATKVQNGRTGRLDQRRSVAQKTNNAFIQRVDRKGQPLSPFRSSLEITGYNVYRSTSAGVATTPENLIATVSDTTIYDDWGDGGNGLQNGTPYYYVVTAVYSSGESTPSNEATATPVNAPPLPPQNLTGGNSGVTVTLNWEASTSYDVAGYYVYAALEGGDFARIDTTTELSSTFDVEDNHFYEFKISAYDNDGAESGFSNEIMLPIGNLPPEQLTAEGGMDGHIMLEWNPPGSTYLTPDTLLFNFEEDNGEFSGDNDWQYGEPTTDPTGAYSGTYAWSTILNSNYTVGPLESALISPEVDLSNYDAPALGFWTWYDIESGFDGGNIKISTDGGSTWELLTPNEGYDDDALSTSFSNPLGGEPAFTGESGGWVLKTFDLSAYADATAIFKFDFGSDSSVDNPGWTIDDVMFYSNAEMYVNGMAYSQYKKQVEGQFSKPTTATGQRLNKQSGAGLSNETQAAPASPMYRDIQSLAGYKIYRATLPNVEVSESTLIATLGDTTMYDDWGDGTGMSNGTTYYYVVVADYGVDGTSSASNEASATPVNAPPLAPSGLTAHVDGMTVSLTWNGSPSYDMNHYVVYRTSGTSGDYSDVGTTEDTTYSDELPVDGAYRYRVMTVDNDGAPSEMSSPSSFMMVGNVPPLVSAESGHDNMVPVEVRPWTPGTEVELTYDDNSAETGIGSGQLPISMAVKMTPNGVGEVKNLKYYWANQTGSQQPVVPMVWADNEGAPGDVLYEGPEFTPDQSNYWQTLPVTNVSFDTVFWVGLAYQTTGGSYLGLDQNGTEYLRSYIQNPNDNSWVEIGVVDPDFAGNLMIRSTILVIPEDKDALSQPILAYNPVYREVGPSKQRYQLLSNSNNSVAREIDWNATQSYEVDSPHSILTDYSKVAETMDITDFQIYRRAESQSDFSLVTTIPASQNLYNDQPVSGQTTYYYYAKAVYAPGNPENISPPSDTISATPSGVVGTEDAVELPTTFAMAQNYPNPFNPTTSIKYQLPEMSKVRIVIFNMLGQQVRTLVNTEQQAGYYEQVWDGLNSRGQQVSSGVYFYSIQAGKYQKTRKMILLR